MTTVSPSISHLDVGIVDLDDERSIRRLDAKIVATKSETWVNPAASVTPSPARASKTSAAASGNRRRGRRGGAVRGDSQNLARGRCGSDARQLWRRQNRRLLEVREPFFEQVGHLGGCLESVGRLLGQEAVDRGLEPLGHVGIELTDRPVLTSQTRLSTAIAESARNGDRPAAIA